MNSIVEAVFAHARVPERPALWFEREMLTYGQLASDVQRFASALSSWGLRPGDRVALFLEASPAFVIAYLGTQLARGIAVPVNTDYRQIELTHLLTDAGVRLCVTSAAGADTLRSLTLPAELATLLVTAGESNNLPKQEKLEQVSFAEFIAGTLARPRVLPPLPALEDPAVIAYTSGTTGRAKGALLCHRNLVSNIATVTATWHWTETDRLLLTLPLFHTHGLMVGLHGTLYSGGSAIVRQRFVAAEVLSTLQDDESITLFFGVPTMYGRLLAQAEEQSEPARQLRLYVSGSAPLSPQLFLAFQRRFGQPILERYGMTETLMIMSNPYEEKRRRPGTVGLPFPGQEARVVDRGTRAPLPAGEIGEIEVKGPNVFSGYWKRPDANAEAFSADGWFKTGDLGSCSPDGYYTITGRSRELIITGGYNVYPREVEDVLLAYPGVGEAAVLGLPDPDLGEQVVAVIVPRPGATHPSAEDLLNFCRAQLAGYKKPRRVIFLDALPRNALGKVQKHVLAQSVLQGEYGSSSGEVGETIPSIERRPK
ncbi:MAG: acyl-CoA synthetase [Ktedonobacterales bacterium]